MDAARACLDDSRCEVTDGELCYLGDRVSELRNSVAEARSHQEIILNEVKRLGSVSAKPMLGPFPPYDVKQGPVHLSKSQFPFTFLTFIASFTSLIEFCS